ncbi:CD40 ligand [Mugil cephalus]|uniref:CD40 ligand n=1 Tax=Mugil cephalus TaxID=48193 RepID=UPI001FB5E853|nr:CD40 ligand [Mugil cephalus]
MINTYQTSLAPPPVPPRLSRSQPVLIPTALPSHSQTSPLTRCLAGIVVLHLLLSLGGFIYLYRKDKMEHFPAGEKAAYSTSERQEMYYKSLAHMVVSKDTASSKSQGYLQWDMNQSVLRKINYYHKSWLTIFEPGDYYVYSRVTFSKEDPVQPLLSRVNLRKNETGKNKLVMEAYCSLGSGSTSVPRVCTATQGKLVTLERGDQLSVWVHNTSLVDYSEGATAFGMYKL